MQELVPGDILVGKVRSWRRAQFELILVSLDCGRLRRVPENITILCTIPQVYLLACNFFFNFLRQKDELLEEGDYVRCVFERFQKDVLIATTDVDVLKEFDPLMSLKTKLGSIDRPRRLSEEAKEKDSIHDIITSSNAYLNPTGSHYILERLGVDLKDTLSFLAPITPPKQGNI